MSIKTRQEYQFDQRTRKIWVVAIVIVIRQIGSLFRSSSCFTSGPALLMFVLFLFDRLLEWTRRVMRVLGEGDHEGLVLFLATLSVHNAQHLGT